ncbi:hypothetical protein LptCag_1529 [Leptospirillum ferriphilum]|uniref:DUF4870 domain-containing protein n=1 Tax=Leptospirillum ferriphilum TaxID=178606 RepID=A0A094X5J0_9BACT|nr:DUF4870 domain-containing protein [Leptospirillum ferriphilum]KGA93819.1 hypothetical protein LptCag_1529 [Leptospirillum ferriphilum]
MRTHKNADIQSSCLRERITSAALYGASLFLFVIPSLVGVFFSEKGSFVHQNSRMILNFDILLLLLAVPFTVLSIVGIGILGFGLVYLLHFAFIGIGLIKSFRGEVWQNPLSFDLINRKTP